MQDSSIIRGRAWKFGDNVDTDVITPADVTSFGLSDESELEGLVKNAFKALRPSFCQCVAKGDVLVAGKNFGFGSHREHANQVIPALGFAAVIADSVARLYFRNALAIGFPIFQIPGVSSIVEEGDQVSVDMRTWTFNNLTRGGSLPVEPYHEMMQRLLVAGGILELLKERIGVRE